MNCIAKQEWPNRIALLRSSVDCKVSEPKYKFDDWEYAEKPKAYNSGILSCTAINISFLWRQLNAFEKSSFTMTWSCGMFCKNRLAECIAASHTPGVPTPNWSAPKYEARRAIPKSLAHLAASRRSVNPMTMGLMSPDFLFSAISLPPKKIDDRDFGQRTASTTFTKAVSDVINSGPAFRHAIKSFKCCGRRPSGP